MRVPADAELIRADDPRFTDLVQPYRTLRELVAESTNLPFVLERLAGVQHRRQQLTVSTVEAEGIRLLAAAARLPHNHERVTALGYRFGLDGRAPSTLSDVGLLLRLSRERVRQIEQAVIDRLPSEVAWAPVLDRALQVAEHLAPCNLADLNAALQGSGLTTVSWSIRALSEAARLSGRSLDFGDQEGVVGRRADLPVIAAIVRTARKISDRNGVANPAQVWRELHLAGEDRRPALVREVLAAHRDVEWLSTPWFWVRHGSAHNRLVNTSLRILAVHQPQTMADMAGGVERYFRGRNDSQGATRRAAIQAPPYDVIGAFYASHPAFHVGEDGLVSAAIPVDLDVLGPEKLIMVKVLGAEPSASMTRPRLVSACLARGMKPGTVQALVDHAECISNQGRNSWGLRGVSGVG